MTAPAQSQVNLNDCGCCEGIAVETPVVINSRPGLSAIAYRAGTQTQFKASMLARLSGSGLAELRKLRTRETDDFTIALLDAWAMVCDVLAFYQERIANESYLLTAIERASIINLARLIGYELGPGVAASTYLAFTLETGTGAPPAVTIDKGVKVQSIPGPGEKPQTFETVEEIDAQGEWNAMKPRLTELIAPQLNDRSMYLEGTTTGLKVGDALLLVGDERRGDPTSDRWDFRLIKTITPDQVAGHTKVTWEKGLGWNAIGKIVEPAQQNLKVYALRQRAAVFGYNAPDWRLLPDSAKAGYLGLDDPKKLTAADRLEWPDFTIFAPVYPPPKAKAAAPSFEDVEATPEAVAAAATSAAQAAAAATTSEAANAGMGVIKSASDMAKTAMNVTVKTAAALENVATTAADEATNSARVAIKAQLIALNALRTAPQEAVASLALEPIKQAIREMEQNLGAVVAGMTTIDSVTGALVAATSVNIAKKILDKVNEAIGAARNQVPNDLVSLVPNANLAASSALDAARQAVSGKKATLDDPTSLFYKEINDISPLGNPLASLDAAKSALNGAWEAVNSVTLQSHDDPSTAVQNVINRVYEVVSQAQITSIFPDPSTVVRDVLGVAADAVKLGGRVGESVQALTNIFISSASVALAATQKAIDDAAASAGSAALNVAKAVNPDNVIAELGQAADDFARKATDAANLATTATGAGGAAVIVSAAVKAAIELDPPNDTTKLQFVITAANLSARAAVVATQHAPEAAALIIAGAGPAYVPIAVAVEVFLRALNPAAAGGAQKVETEVNQAVESAKQPKRIPLPTRPFQTSLDPKKETIDLDAVYQKIVKDSWLVLSIPTYDELYQITDVTEASRAQFSLTAKTTRVKLKGENLAEKFEREVRTTTIFGESEELQLAETPIGSPVWKDRIVLDQTIEPPDVGRQILVTGKRMRVQVEKARTSFTLVSVTDPSQNKDLETGVELIVLGLPVDVDANTKRWLLLDEGGLSGYVNDSEGKITFVAAREEDAIVSEVATIKSVEAADETHTRLVLSASLSNVFDRATVTINANVALGTHGETVANEVLGSGDAGQPYQRFALRQAPLTYTSADTPSGGETTLEVRVNDLKWKQVPTLFDRGPRERVYITHTDDDQKTSVQFGDGVTGARLPMGRENVTATYRKGIGLEGLVKASQLSLLMTRPLGVKSVINPLAATGAQDPQTVADARANSPLTVLTLDRIVSLSDYEDFARSFSGIAKALATWTWNLHARGIYVTVAGIDGAEVDQKLHDTLMSAMLTYADAHVPITIKSYRPVTFRLVADVKVDPDYIEEKVLAAVEAALRSGFSFTARSFGQPVTLSEVVSAMQNVAGVVAVDVNKLYRSDEAEAWNSLLAAEAPQAGDDAGVPAAELLTLDPAPLELGVMP